MISNANLLRRWGNKGNQDPTPPQDEAALPAEAAAVTYERATGVVWRDCSHATNDIIGS